MRSGRTLRRIKKNNLEDEAFIHQIQEEIEIEAENDHGANDMNASDNFDQMQEEIDSEIDYDETADNNFDSISLNKIEIK